MQDSKFSIISVFTDNDLGFKGNTSSVIHLAQAVSNEKMQTIASDFNQPATTFLWEAENSNRWHVRWFAPDGEIDLCGHGSLAAFAFLPQSEEKTTLLFKNGTITGRKLTPSSCEMYIEAIHSVPGKASPIVSAGLGKPVVQYLTNNNKHIVLLKNEESLQSMRPDFAKLRESEVFGYTVTAPGDKVDFVSRTIVPHVQQLEDQATGSSHAALTPFWAEKLNKDQMIGHQLSKRGGKFLCSIEGSQVKLTGEFEIIANGHLIAP